jgi:two-component system sensor histidine kinase PhoQ
MPLLRSLRARVLLWVSVTLVVLFALTIVGLDAAFTRSSDRALEELLEAQLLGLIALAEPDARGELTLPDAAVDPRFDVADAGLYGALWDEGGRVLWQSLSLVGRQLPLPESPPPGEAWQIEVQPAGLPPLLMRVMGITWEFADRRVRAYTLGIAVSLEPYQARQRAFRLNLIGWFAGITATMLLVITGLLTFVLRPLRRLEAQVREVEAGERASLGGTYPSELEGLAGNLNALIDTERRREARYRNTLDDLAHSLKTPLAVMKTLLSERSTVEKQKPELQRELGRMEQRVSYQLRKARVSGATGLGVEPVPVAPLLEDLKTSLDKVYREKRVECRLVVTPDATFRGDKGDLTEIAGNVMENAYKYCRREVAVSAGMRGPRLRLVVGDDGAGISAEHADDLLERGTRADESVPGHGIGLAVVRETVGLYQGSIELGRSDLGGLEVRIELGKASAQT